jgi:hypothetical protein
VKLIPIAHGSRAAVAATAVTLIPGSRYFTNQSAASVRLSHSQSIVSFVANVRFYFVDVKIVNAAIRRVVIKPR